jgi:hypothetical protein
MVRLDVATQTAITQGIALLREGSFLHAHECFEDAWRNSVCSERTYFHALAQLAASHYQLAQGRARAAVRTWLKARDKLAKIGALSPELQRSMDTFHGTLGLSESEPRFIDVKRLPPVEQWPCPEDMLPFVSDCPPPPR